MLTARALWGAAATLLLACSGGATHCSRSAPVARSRVSTPSPPPVRSSSEPASSASALPSASAATPLPPPLASTEEVVSLAVEGFRDAAVSLPHGATDKRPVIVALHGNYDRPEWQCEVWRDALRPRAFILCPRGMPRGDVSAREDRWTYGAVRDLAREVQAGMDALVRRYPDYVDRTNPVLIGFSLGAILTVHWLGQEDFPFRRMVLVEGGHAGWSAKRSKALTPDGRVLFACGQGACRATTAAAVRALQKQGVASEGVGVNDAGHTYDGKVASAVQSRWNWLVDGDPRFAQH